MAPEWTSLGYLNRPVVPRGIRGSGMCPADCRSSINNPTHLFEPALPHTALLIERDVVPATSNVDTGWREVQERRMLERYLLVEQLT